MKKSKKTEKVENHKNYVSEYNEIFESSENSVVVRNEWAKNGDFFEKITIYDNSYIQFGTLGGTTLIKPI